MCLLASRSDLDGDGNLLMQRRFMRHKSHLQRHCTVASFFFFVSQIRSNFSQISFRNTLSIPDFATLSLFNEIKSHPFFVMWRHED